MESRFTFCVCVFVYLWKCVDFFFLFTKFDLNVKTHISEIYFIPFKFVTKLNFKK